MQHNTSACDPDVSSLNSGLKEPLASLPDPVADIARERFGVKALYPYQRFVIANSIDLEPGETRHQLVILPTGAGKTLCFQLPTLVLGGMTVVVYPLLSLMGDQQRRAAQAGIGCAVLKGGQDGTTRREIFAKMTSGEIKLLITNPETLASPPVLRILSQQRIDHLVVDEAHCTIQWGKTFRPSYLELGRIVDALGATTVTAFTATAGPAILEGIKSVIFGDRRVHQMVSSPDRSNIAYSVIQTPSRSTALRLLAQNGMPRPMLVFARSRTRVESLARMLCQAMPDSAVGAYHAGMAKDTRAQIEHWFFGSADGILVATCAYGMGVDKSNIRSTVHFDQPPSIEAFLQESGRAGRDGDSAESVVLWSGADEEPNPPDVPPDAVSVAPDLLTGIRHGQSDRFAGYCLNPGCRRDFLMQALAAESVPCFGCDHCRGQSGVQTPLEMTIAPPSIGRSTAMLGEIQRQFLQWIWLNRRRFRRKQIPSQLTADRNRLSKRLRSISTQEIEEWIGGLLAANQIRTLRNPWAGRVTTSRAFLTRTRRGAIVGV